MFLYKNISVLLAIMLSFTAMAQTEDATEEVTKQGAKIALQFNDNDSMHVVNATVTDSVTGTPLADIGVTFYIKRFYGFMQVGEGTTDSTGFATAEFPRDIRADVNGKSTFIAKIEDNDVVNNTEQQMELKPDLPYVEREKFKRAMFARRAPWWLVISFAGLVGTVWIVFVYVLFLIKRIRNAGVINVQK